MSVSSEIQRIKTCIANAYTNVSTKGGILPTTQNVNNLASAVATIPSGTIPTGKINITDTNETNVTNYATAQVVDSNLTAENIKKNTTILGITGTYEGSGGGAEPDWFYIENISDTNGIITLSSPNSDFILLINLF